MDQLVADLRHASGWEVLLDAENRPLDLKRQLVGLPIRRLAAVVEPIETAGLVALADYVAGRCEPRCCTARFAVMLQRSLNQQIDRWSISAELDNARGRAEEAKTRKGGRAARAGATCRFARSRRSPMIVFLG